MVISVGIIIRNVYNPIDSFLNNTHMYSPPYELILLYISSI
nr:MAG TPA: hypothetical protein [Caudoviricetes sp.]